MSDASDLVSYVNSQRNYWGRSTLLVDPQLTAMAEESVQYMIQNGQVQHHPALNWLLTQGWTKVAENVGNHSGSAWDVHVMFSYSTEHANNQNDPVMDGIGVGAVRHNGLLWVSEIFGAVD